MQFRTHCILVGLTLVGGVGLWLIRLAAGYFANPVPFGYLTPLVILLIGAYCLILPLVYIVRGIALRRDRRHTVLAAVALFSLVWLFLPGLPTDVDAFEY